MFRYDNFVWICFYTLTSFAAAKVGLKYVKVSEHEYFFSKVWKENFLEPQNQFHAKYLSELPTAKLDSNKN